MSPAILVATLLLPTISALQPPLLPPFQHWRAAKRGRLQGCNNVTHDVRSYGASSSADAATNQAAINAAFAAMQPCDTLLIPSDTYSVLGGVVGRNLRNATIIINGQLNFVDPSADAFGSWPMSPSEPTKKYADCFSLSDSIDVAITSDSRGGLNGNGRVWWNKVIVGDLPPHKNTDFRPKLLKVSNCADVLVEYIDLVNSPSWNFEISAVRAEIRFLTVKTDRSYLQSLKKKAFGDIKSRLEEWLLDEAMKLLPSFLLQPEDLNTDGIDPSGVDFWIHDCDISNDDDSIAVKPSGIGHVGIDGSRFNCSQNMLIESSKLVGFGASIGSVGPTKNRGCVDAITMRNISMPGTGKGVYIKSNQGDCIGTSSQLSNLRFEGIDIIEPSWYAIWIGPQQQQEPHSKLGSACSLIYPLAGSQCPTQGCSDFENITLKDITITNPLLSPGAIMGNASNPMRNLVFENVIVKQDSLIRGRFPWRKANYPWIGTYKSINAPGVCRGCSPVPDGFTRESQGNGDHAAQGNEGGVYLV